MPLVFPPPRPLASMPDAIHSQCESPEGIRTRAKERSRHDTEREITRKLFLTRRVCASTGSGTSTEQYQSPTAVPNIDQTFDDRKDVFRTHCCSRDLSTNRLIRTGRSRPARDMVLREAKSQAEARRRGCFNHCRLVDAERSAQNQTQNRAASEPDGAWDTPRGVAVLNYKQLHFSRSVFVCS